MAYQFNSEQIAPSHVKCNRTVSSRQEVAEQLAAALAECKVKPTVVPGFERIAPRPVRMAKVDPSTKLKRRKSAVPASVALDLERARKAHEDSVKIMEMVDRLEGGDD